MERHPLPSGGWVDIEDPKTVRAGTKRLILAQYREDQAEGEQVLLAFDRLCQALIKAWHVPGMPGGLEPDQVPLPSARLSILDDLSPGDYAVIERVIMPAVGIVMGGKPSPDQHEDPASPSVPASV